MPESVTVTKAELWELDPSGEPISGSRVPVQFNPETLKVSFANQIVPPGSNQGAGDQNGTSTTQHVGKGTTKLSVQLWFDVTGVLPQEGNSGPAASGQTPVSDVRELTKKVAYFITPKEDPADPTKNVPPAIQFLWGTFQFDGVMESLEESLEFFSSEGVPLRASLSLNLSQQRIEFVIAKQGRAGGVAGPGTATPGTRPLTQAAAGSTLQAMAAAVGKQNDWQSIAAANGIENPRMLRPGQLIDLNARVGRS